jgi:hypothetical protein
MNDRREYYKQYRKVHKDRIQKNTLKNKERRKLYRKTRREYDRVYDYKYTDKKKGLVSDLTVEWFKENITSQPCTYCGSTEKIGCDRVDNNKGHNMDNVIPCCDLCNQTRSNNFTVAEMIRIGSVIKQIKAERNVNNRLSSCYK